MIQDGSGMIVPSGSGGAIIQSRDGFSGTFAPYSEATLTVKANTGDGINFAIYNFIGDIV